MIINYISKIVSIPINDSFCGDKYNGEENR